MRFFTPASLKEIIQRATDLGRGGRSEFTHATFSVTDAEGKTIVEPGEIDEHTQHLQIQAVPSGFFVPNFEAMNIGASPEEIEQLRAEHGDGLIDQETADAAAEKAFEHQRFLNPVPSFVNADTPINDIQPADERTFEREDDEKTQRLGRLSAEIEQELAAFEDERDEFWRMHPNEGEVKRPATPDDRWAFDEPKAATPMAMPPVITAQDEANDKPIAWTVPTSDELRKTLSAPKPQEEPEDEQFVDRLEDFPSLLHFAANPSDWAKLRVEQLIRSGMDPADAVERTLGEVRTGCLGRFKR